MIEQIGETFVSSSEIGNIWYVDYIEINGADGQEFSPETEGDYFLRVISIDGCISDPSDIVTFTVSNLIKIGMSEITLFPNPVRDHLYFSPGQSHETP